jgi:hypothetical protein
VRDFCARPFIRGCAGGSRSRQALISNSMHARRQKACCAICAEPILEGDGIRRVSLPGTYVVRPVHPRCFERDWERLLSGLEPFPLRFGKPSP